MAFGYPGVPGSRATPGVEPVPNSEPVGALNGAPPRTGLYSRNVTSRAGEIVLGTAENRLVVITAPIIGWNIYVGDSSVNIRNGMRVPNGIPFNISIPGLQSLYAITNAPMAIPISVEVAIILMAERQRIVG